MSKKTLTALFLALAFIVGCRTPSKKTTVTFWHAMGGESQKTLKTMVDRFESTHANIHIELVGMGNYDALSQKLMGAVAAKNPPTIAQMYENWTTQLHAGGELVYLDSFVHGPDGLTQEDMADIYPALLENNSWDGRLLTLPFNKSVPVYYYNVPMFASAGYPEFPKTWSEFRTAANRMTRRDAAGNVGVWGAAGGTDIWIFGSMLFQRGSRFLEQEDGRPLFNGKEGVDALQFQVDMVLKDKTQNTDVGRTPMDDFQVGRMATLTGSSTWRAPVVDKETFPVGMAPVPTWGKPAAIVYGTNIGMFRRATAQQKAAAWTFIKWFTAPEQQVEWSLGTWYVPIHRRSLEDPRLVERLAKTPGLAAAYAQMDCAVFEPRGLKWLAGRKALVEELEQAMLGAKTPKQALDDAAARYSGSAQ
ncbi:MAG: ABC transporter substrate-binding protein [candidate division WOR-3 bacterium]|nr:ABC transporter substrate-binding protein [candidate division WOR-3 bacterium]